MFPYEYATEPSIKEYLESITNKEVSLEDSSDKASQKIYENHIKHYDEINHLWQKQNEVEENKKLLESKHSDLLVSQNLSKTQKKRMEIMDIIKDEEDSEDLSLTNKDNCENELCTDEIFDNVLKPTSFEIIGYLGAGAFGTVYLVKNKINSEFMALKKIDKAKMKENDMQIYAFLERKIMLEFNHPFIIKLKHSFQTPLK